MSVQVNSSKLNYTGTEKFSKWMPDGWEQYFSPLEWEIINKQVGEGKTYPSGNVLNWGHQNELMLP